MNKIKIRGLIQNNLKNIDLDTCKHQITIFTGVSGSGKFSIVFDAIATESKRPLNKTFPAFIRSKNTDLRVLFSRIGEPYCGSSSHFSFNDAKGMCPSCSGLGQVMTIDIDNVIDYDKSLNEGCILDSSYTPGSWYWRQIAESKLFDLDKKIRDYKNEEINLLFYGSKIKGGKQVNAKAPGLTNRYQHIYLKRDISGMSKTMKTKAKRLTKMAG